MSAEWTCDLCSVVNDPARIVCDGTCIINIPPFHPSVHENALKSLLFRFPAKPQLGPACSVLDRGIPEAR